MNILCSHVCCQCIPHLNVLEGFQVWNIDGQARPECGDWAVQSARLATAGVTCRRRPTQYPRGTKTTVLHTWQESLRVQATPYCLEHLTQQLIRMIVISFCLESSKKDNIARTRLPDSVLRCQLL